jgi:ADP-ribosylglycohydrolase
VPSIAYRLALVAAGEGDLALTRVAPVGWDYAAGHALLRAAGGELYGGAGVAVTYTAEGVSRCAPRCIGGLPAMAAVLLARDWSSGRQPSRTSEPYGLCTPRPGRAITDDGMLARAQGCLLGQLAGDALGAQVEFRAGGEIAAAYPGGLREMDDGGTWGTLAGQPTDDSELALALARSAVEYGGYDSEAAARAYAYWYESRPFDMGQTTRSALEATAAAVRAGKPAAEAALRAANRTSQANGALMRVSPLGILGAALGHGRAAEWARADAALTHPNSICLDVNAIFAETLAAVIRSGGDAESAYDYARAAADRLGVAPEISAALRAAHDDPPAAYQANQGWVLLAFQNAYYQLLHAEGTEAGIVDTVMRGGDTDTNAAIAGALLGAVYGRDSVPPQWRGRVLSCRPVAGLEGVRHPRPAAFWPVDALWLAERLLLAAA